MAMVMLVVPMALTGRKVAWGTTANCNEHGAHKARECRRK